MQAITTTSLKKWGLAGLLALPLAAAAQTSYFGAAEFRAWAIWNQADPPDHAEHMPAPVTATESGALPLAGAASNTANSPASTGTGNASYDVRPGGLHIAASASAQGVGSEGSSAAADTESFVSALLTDHFVLTVGNAAPGTLFTVYANIAVSGLLHSVGQASDPGPLGSAGYSGISTWAAEASVFNNTSANSYAIGAGGFCRDEYGVGRACGGADFGNFSLVFTAAVGQLNEITLYGDARAQAYGSFGGVFGMAGTLSYADLGHTIAWGGIQSVQDANGNPMTGYSALSATSGFDYSQPYASAVPEPAVWLSMSLGLMLLARRKVARRA